MPFKKVGPDDYTSPSGRHWNGKQVRLYYATDGFKDSPREKPDYKKEPGNGRKRRKARPV